MGEARTIESGDAQIACESFGSEADPPVLLIMGQMASMLWWPAGFCEQLAAQGRFVIRYDNRDTGLSTSYPPGEPPYGGADLVADAAAVLDGYGIGAAHVMGMSMGGALAQVVTLTHPERVRSLTLASTTFADDSGGDLPGPTERYLEHMQAGEQVDWSDPASFGPYIVRDMRELSGTRHPFDQAGAEEHVRADLERARDPAALINHTVMEQAPVSGRVADIAAPTLVIHGTSDPLFPAAHGRALAEAIPGATLVTVEGGGHEVHRGDWDQYVAAVAGHTAT